MVETDDESAIRFVAYYGSDSDKSVLEKLCELLKREEPEVFVPALRAVGNLLTSNNHEVIDLCLWNSALQNIASRLDDPK